MKKKKIFRKEKCIESEINRIIKCKDYKSLDALAVAISPDGWVSECDGREVTECGGREAIAGYIDDFIILNKWCEEVEDEEDI